ncbi:Transcriptional regulatory protein DegU [Pontivivens insulae]|uniref:Transcriptional regulatory protein DegU n=2 Tax=Pontivivens insulae TaxID=1639689 RepID=A0A2R8AAC9_9RHOB|nr:LuxR family two component transcriptional regulator [Pontivivens insulae]SPF29045.1 Transcriptional regulatory protein DegU [Pontivivens insulae]
MQARIAIVDDHALFLDGVVGLLQDVPELGEVVPFLSGLDLLTALSQGAPFDLIVTDLTMKDLNGLALISALRSKAPGVPVLVLSASADTAMRANAESVGAVGFLHKSVGKAELVEALQLHLTEGQADKKSRPDDAVLAQPQLGPRQLSVLALLAEGASNREIADRLFISENTVKTHLKAIFRELDAHTRTAVVQRARELALI